MSKMQTQNKKIEKIVHNESTIDHKG